MTGRRGALPLALLIFGVLIAGVAIALVRLGEPDEPGKALPSPDKTTVSPTPTDGKTSPTQEPTEEPTDGPTEEPTNGPTDGPTEEPTDGPTETTPPGNGGTPGDGPTPLAKTGGESAPWMIFGALLVGLSAVLGRLARRPS